VGGAVAIDASSGLTVCGAAGAAAGFGASAEGGAESVEAEADGAVAIDASSGLTICEAAGFGVSAGWARSIETGADGAVGIGAPSGPILIEGASAGAWFGGVGVNVRAVGSRPEEARCDASISTFP